MSCTLAILLSVAAARLPVLPVPIPGLGEWDRQNLERNLRWMLARERAKPTGSARVAVFADAGVWHEGARAVVETLESGNVPCRVLDRSQLTAETLKPFEAVVLPGGWAPFQVSAAGDAGQRALKRYVEGGGRCVGICAGAYFLCAQVRYDGVNYPYPIGLFDGTAEGPVPGLAVFPKPGTVRLKPTTVGAEQGLKSLGERDLYFSGGPAFVGGTGVVVLAKYPDGSAAIVRRSVGKGEVVLIGAHPELPVKELPGAAGVLKSLVLSPRP